MAQSRDSNCPEPASSDDFVDYIRYLREQTSFQEQRLFDCRQQICSFLWGTGNPDISGIGVAAGFFIEVLLGLVLCSIAVVINSVREERRLPGGYRERIRKCTIVCLHTFFDCATYFSVAIEIAATVVLAKKDFSITQDGFGALDTQMALVISVVCMLPLLHQMVRVKSAVDELALRTKPHGSFLFLLTTALFFYPFISQCIRNWAPSRIGKGRGEGGTTIVERPEWEMVEATCFPDTQSLSSTEHLIMSIFELLASLLVLFTALWKIATVISVSRVKERERGAKQLVRHMWFRIMDLGKKVLGGETLLSQLLFTFLPPALAAPLLWAMVRLREAQSQLAQTTDDSYAGNEWGFGQVMSIVVFLPVFVEGGYLWLDT